MADDGFVTGCRHWYCPGQQKFRVSSSFSASLLRRLTLPASNIDAMFQKHHYLMFPSKSIHTDGIRAGVMVGTFISGRYIWLLISPQSSFGFGQVGGTALVLHPRYLFGALEPSAYAAYKCKNEVRAQQAYKSMSEMMITNSLVKIKDAPPYTPELEVPVLLNSMARATLDAKTGGYSFPKKLANEVTVDKANAKTIADIIAGTGSAVGVGVDQGMLHLLT
jgi:fatty acid synthase subunit alpha